MNDKITEGVQAVGICCPFAYFCVRQGKHDKHKKLAEELGLSIKAIEWNKKKWREGNLTCVRLSICQHATKKP